MSIKELLKSEEFKWFNIFVRDIILIGLLIYINVSNSFKSYWVGFLTGMAVVYVSWQFTDYLNEKRRLL